MDKNFGVEYIGKDYCVLKFVTIKVQQKSTTILTKNLDMVRSRNDWEKQKEVNLLKILDEHADYSFEISK